MKKYFYLLFTLSLCACATSPVSTDQAKEVTGSDILDQSLLVKKEGYGQVVVKRDRGLNTSACDTRIYANGRPVADLGTGDKVTFYLPPGEQMLAAKANGICTGGLVEAAVTVNPAKTSIFRISYGSWGEFTIQPTAF